MSNKQGKRLNPFQHALARPDAYIGSCVTTTKELLVCDVKTDDDLDVEDDDGNINIDLDEEPKIKTGLVMKKIKYNIGLTRLYIEAQSNAIDNKWRSENEGVKMTSISFECDDDPESEWYGYITVTNDGYAIPVVKSEYEYEDHRTGKKVTESLYPAEVFFGDMFAGTNFEDDPDKKTSGRNGMGGKTDVIFTDHTDITHGDPDAKKQFHQEYRDHGKQRSTPKITAYSNKTGYFTICFHPDYEYFNYPGMDSDLVSLLKRYAYETAMITGLKITFNGEKINVKGLEKFVRSIYPDTKENCLLSFAAPTGDECVLVEKGVPEMDQMDDVPSHSWINGINTRDGGTHVVAWKDYIFPALVKIFNARKPKKGEKTVLKAAAKEMYPYFTLFVRCEVSGPKFDGQTKDYLNYPETFILAEDKNAEKEFKKMIAEKLVKTLKWNFITLLEEKLAAKSDRALSRKEGVKKKLSYGKNLREANFAGTKQGGWCTLCVCEGLSAKAFVDGLVAKMENGNDYYGAFAVRGKFINALKASTRELNANEEVKALKQIIGLRTGEVYDSVDTFRYGAVMFFTDQDDDGIHIEGLLDCFFHTCWPSLFTIVSWDELPFIRSFETMVSYTMKGKKLLEKYYNNPSFDNWYKSQSAANLKGITTKYLKGLGSHKPGDEELYLNDQRITYYNLDGEEEKFMVLGFHSKFTDQRKEWITRDMPKPGEISVGGDDVVESRELAVGGDISLSNFVNTWLIIYHIMALTRALPNVYDGFKDSQRRIYYGVSTNAKAKKGTVGLEKLMGTVGEVTGYHHGAVSLENTSKGMAQGFVGANNIALLVNDGQFGTRAEGGKDAAAARYIATMPEEIAKTIFDPLDEPLLEGVYENDPQGNPLFLGYKFYIPVVPPLLFNGPKGIATGFSSETPNYNPTDITVWIRKWLVSPPLYKNKKLGHRKVNLPLLVPWYRGFNGTIELLEYSGDPKNKYKVFDPETSKGRPIAWRSIGILEPSKTKGWYSIRDIPIGMWTNRMKEWLEYLYTGSPPEGSKKKKADQTYISDLRWEGSANSPHWEFKPTKEFIPDINVKGNFKNMQTTGVLTNMHVLDENGYPRRYTSPEDILQDFCIVRLRYYGLRRKHQLSLLRKEYVKEQSRSIFVRAVSPQLDNTLDLYQDDAEVEAAMIDLGLEKSDDSFDYLLSMQIRSMTVKRLEQIEKDILKIKVKIDELEAKTPEELWVSDLDRFDTAWAKYLKTRKEE